jgi:eukaryotic-like serine/threonine-protein kinase
MNVATAGRGVYVTSDGRATTLGPLLKSGGAGSVHRVVERPDEVAKLYHPGGDHAQYQRKIAAMLSFTPDLPDIADRGSRYVQIAWPRASLYDARRRFVGFTMPLLDVGATSELEEILQERQARAAGLPTGLGAKITLAANLAGVVAALHRQQHYVVDLKPVNLRFYRESLYMAMLDCDGFSIHGEGGRHVAQQVTPDYLAPEFQRDGARALREEDQDRFALAVVVFQLLNFGIHPYSGRPSSSNVPTDIPARIQGHYYAYGTRAHPGISPNPVSGHAALPVALRSLFDRAFAGQAHARPAAREWVDTLQTYARRSAGSLLVCGKDPDHQHFAAHACAACSRAMLIADARRAAARPRPGPAVRSTPTLRGKLARHGAPRPMPGARTYPPVLAPRLPSTGAQRRSATYSRHGTSPAPRGNPYLRLLFAVLTSRLGLFILVGSVVILAKLFEPPRAPRAGRWTRPEPTISIVEQRPSLLAGFNERRLRVATLADFAAFDFAYAQRYGMASPRLSQRTTLPGLVIIGKYEFDADESAGVVFFRASGAPRPTASEHASFLLDLEEGTCRGQHCRALGLQRAESPSRD